MKISSITATADKIKIRLSGVEAGIGITVKAFVPLIVGNAKENKMPGRQVVSHTAEAEEVIGLPRFKDGYDLAPRRSFFEIGVKKKRHSFPYL